MRWIGQHIPTITTRLGTKTFIEEPLQATGDTDRFLVFGNQSSIGARNQIMYRTGDEIRSDIGAGVSSFTSVTIQTDDGSSERIELDKNGNSFQIIGADGVDVTNEGTTITIQVAIDEIDHDNLNNFASQEHFIQSAITTVGTIGTGVWNGTPITTEYIGDDQITEDKLTDSLLAEIDANTAKATNVATNLSQTTGTDTLRIDSSDGTNVTIAEASGSIAGVMTVAHHDKLDGIETSATADQTNAEIKAAVEAASDSNTFTDADHTKLNGIETSATADQTKSDIDGLAITTVGTVDTGVWEGTAIASDQQKHLMHYQTIGYGTPDGTNYYVSRNMATNTAPFKHEVSVGADGLTAQTPQTWLRLGGHIMPRACTLKKWTGWVTANGSGTHYVGLFKVTLTRNSNTTVSAVLLEEFSFTALGNTKPEDFAETSFTATAIAAGDILITGLKGVSGKIMYFNASFEVEF